VRPLSFYRVWLSSAPAALFWVLSAATVSATTFTVTNTADSGANSLRDALTLAQNCTGSPHTIAFNVPGGSLTGGVAVITLVSTLPSVTCAGTTIDGTTQTANGGNTNNVTLGTGGTVGTGPDGRAGTGDELTLPELNGPEVELVGNSLGGSILVLQADNVTVQGLSLHGGGDFSGSGTGSGNIDVESGTGILIEMNVIGATATSFTNPGGAAQTQNNGVRLNGGSNITIQQNLIGFTRWRGVMFINAAVSTPTIQQNEFAGSFDGIDFCNEGCGPAGTKTVTRNLFRDNVDNGSGSTMFGVGMFQGTGSAGITDNTFTNAGYGVLIDVDGPVTVQHNVISGGPFEGISAFVFAGSFPSTITQNSIFGNRLGIDLTFGATGVNGNDGTKSALQPNSGMDYPIFTSASVAGSTLTIAGYVGNNPSGSATFANVAIEVFKADNVPANQDGEIIAGDGLSVPHGEGRTYLGTITADALGQFSTTLPVPAGVTLVNGDAITATATDQAGVGLRAPGPMGHVRSGAVPTGALPAFNNTSEFGANAVLPFPPVINTPTPTNTPTNTPTSTPTSTRTNTPGQVPAAIVPTLSFPMLALLALALGALGWLLSRR